MKNRTLYIIIGLMALVLIYQQLTIRSYKKGILHTNMQNQVEKIQERARAFMEHNYGTSSVNGGYSFSYLEDYELVLSVPEGKETEFKEWMQSYRLTTASIDGLPIARRTSYEVKDEKIFYRVHYGSNISDK